MTGETTNINIRMDKALKEQAESLLSELGMNMTTAFNIFLRQTVRERAIPFQISANMPRRKAILTEGQELLKSIQEDSVKNGTDKMTLDDINAEITAHRQSKKRKAAAQA
ncbi:MAG: type II toxin-antitoxin system RelB/DinJ family antitoxin [Defluviitaleaceae bacterium]|jgi:DNA-damage-inducible protein J|nr:type II toxin-antitoxin system RelB/DinJ family antitoxin [Defluviitaleaceae bacterium]